MKKSFKQAAIGCLLILMLIFGFSTIGSAQTENSDDDAPIVVPDEQMRQIVQRILIYNFKPSKKPKVLFLAKRGIQKEWLPEIKNIRYVLLSDEEIEETGDVYFFTEAVSFIKGTNQISFAYGDPDCRSVGTSWNFRVLKQKLRIWKSNGSIVGRCFSPPPPKAVSILGRVKASSTEKMTARRTY